MNGQLCMKTEECNISMTLQWRHIGRDSVWNHQPHDCLRYRLFRGRSKKTSKLPIPGLCARNSPGTSEFPAQLAIYEENVSIWRHHHGYPANHMISSEWHYSIKGQRSLKYKNLTLPPPPPPPWDIKNGPYFAYDVFKCIFVNWTFCILIKFHWSLFLGIQLKIKQLLCR